MSSNQAMKNGCELIYEMFHILNCGCEIKLAMIIAVANAIDHIRILIIGQELACNGG